MPRHLTLTELVLSLLLYGVVGWWLGGRPGLAIGVALLLGLCFRAIWIASRRSDPAASEREHPPGESPPEL